MNEQLEFLRLVVSRLDQAGIPYMLTGWMALSVYAPPRMTRDLDFVIQCRLGDAARLVELFKEDCYIEESAVLAAIEQERSFNVIHNEWIVKADFIVRRDSDYQRAEFQRRRSVSFGEWSIWVVSPEDLLLSKLQWSRNGESELQRRDARQLASSMSSVDWEYLCAWASELGLSEFLAEVEPE